MSIFKFSEDIPKVGEIVQVQMSRDNCKTIVKEAIVTERWFDDITSDDHQVILVLSLANLWKLYLVNDEWLSEILGDKRTRVRVELYGYR